MKKNLIGLISLFVIISILGACGTKNTEEVVNANNAGEEGKNFTPDVEYEIEDFEMINHHGEKVSLDSLKGKPWIGMFIFTKCTTVCPPMTYNMTEIQEELIKLGVEDYNIIGFTVDPENDSPEVLSEYLSQYPVPDESKWLLLTGYDQEYIEQFALNSFKSFVKKPAEGDQVVHMTLFHLVDENGVIVKNYSGYTEDSKGIPYEEIATDMDLLIKDIDKDK